MYLNAKIAKEIISEISPFINFDLNLMNSSGLIIASTDERRVNTLHKGAEILINENMESLIIDSDDLYDGCKNGVNLPIRFIGQLIGVIGITGSPSETIKYAYILQKMTEMLLYEIFESSNRASKESSNLMLINDLIHGNIKDSLFNIEERLIQSGLNIQGPFSAALIYTIPQETAAKPMVVTPLAVAKEGLLKKHILNFWQKHHVLCAHNGEFYIAISSLPLEKLKGVLSMLMDSIASSYGLKTLITVSNEYSQYLDIPKTYNEALVVRHHLKNHESGIFFFNSVVLDLVISQIPQIHKKNLFTQVFKDCTESETLEFRQFIIDYFNVNGSLCKLAQAHFIHKNTVQYKINKIAIKTGFDLRIYDHLFILYLAAMYYYEFN